MNAFHLIEDFLDLVLRQHEVRNWHNSDLDDQVRDFYAANLQENTQFWSFMGGDIGFHDREFRVVSERKRLGKYHTRLAGAAPLYLNGQQQSEVEVEMEMVAHAPLRPYQYRDISRFIVLPSQNVLGLLYHRPAPDSHWGHLTKAVIGFDDLKVRFGRGAILSHRQAHQLQDSVQPSASVKRKPRF